MNPSHLITRFALWYTVERAVAVFMAFFGLHITAALYAHAGRASSAFATILPHDGGGQLETVTIIVAPLLIGSGCLWLGLLRNAQGWVMVGLLLAIYVCVTAFISCCYANFWGTGVGAYFGLSMFPFVCFLRRCCSVALIPVVLPA